MYPRAVTVASEGLYLPAGTLLFMLSRKGTLQLIYAGYGLWPWIRDGEEFTVTGGTGARVGDLVLCETDGVGDIRRILILVRNPALGGDVLRLL
jgi:hypothetical protein